MSCHVNSKPKFTSFYCMNIQSHFGRISPESETKDTSISHKKTHRPWTKKLQPQKGNCVENPSNTHPAEQYICLKHPSARGHCRVCRASAAWSPGFDWHSSEGVEGAKDMCISLKASAMIIYIIIMLLWETIKHTHTQKHMLNVSCTVNQHTSWSQLLSHCRPIKHQSTTWLRITWLRFGGLFDLLKLQ